MKKFLTLALALMMLVCVSACAETAYTYSEYIYDETMFEGITGEWVAMPDLGLQMFLPDIYEAAEVSEAMAAIGAFGFYTTNSSGMLMMTYGPAVNVEGNPAEYAEDIADYFTARGMTNVDVIFVNGLAVVTALDANADALSYCVFFGDGTQCVFTFNPASDPDHAMMAALTATSIMPVA